MRTGKSRWAPLAASLMGMFDATREPGHETNLRVQTAEGEVGACAATRAGNRGAPAGWPDGRTGFRRRRRWTLNGDFVTLSLNGVARYARETVEALDALVGEGHPLTRDLALDLVAPRPHRLEHIPVRVVPEFRSPRLPQFWVQAQLPWYVPGGLVSFCNLAPVALSRQIVCVHDLHTFLMPESYGWGFRMAHRLMLPLIGRRAAKITTVSGLSREHIASRGVASSDKIRVTYNGSEHAGRWQAEKALLQMPARRDFVLCLGRGQKYKNMELVWKIAEPLDRLGVDVYVAGDISSQAIAELSPVTPANIFLLGRVSDDDLAMLLSRALCFLFPSRIEGFGIPAVEAMSHGCPVVASSSPCLPEVCGDAALYADPDDHEGWVSAVLSLKGNRRLADTLRERGRLRALRFSWRRIAKDYLELMAEIDAAPMTLDARTAVNR